MSCEKDKPDLEYETQDDTFRRQWVPDMLHTHGYGEAVIAFRVAEAALSVLKEMEKRGLLDKTVHSEAVARGLGKGAAMKVAFYWHDKKPPHAHEKEEKG